MAKRSTTIRISPKTHDRALARLKALGFTSFSDYVETLCLVDQDQGLEFTLVRDAEGGRWSVDVARTDTSPADSSSIPIREREGSPPPQLRA